METSKTKIVLYLVLSLLLLGSISSIFLEFTFFTWCWYAFQVFLLWFAADFITGVIHWWEDTYGNPNWKVIGKYVVEPNLVHHKQPHKLLEGSYWNRVNTSFYAATIIGGGLWSIDLLSWRIIVCLLFCTQGNEVHAMTHRPDRITSKCVCFLQKVGLFQNKKMHRWHHKAPYETNFCVMTDFCNPILNKIDFWGKLEWLILKILRIEVLRASPVRQGL